MHLPIIVLFLTTSARGTFITYRDEVFNDEDPRIVEELRRRTNHDVLIRTFKPYKIKIVKEPRRPSTAPPPSSPPVPPSSPPLPLWGRNTTHNFRRHYSYGTRTTRHFPIEGGDRIIRHKQIELIEQAIYAAQYRIKDVEPIVKKYLDLLEFRISFIYKRLEMIEAEMEVIYSMLLNDKLVEIKNGAKRRVYEYIVYYEHVLSKHVDVTYMCERVAWLHENDKDRRMEEVRQKMQDQKFTHKAPAATRSYGKDDVDSYDIKEREREGESLKLLHPPLKGITQDLKDENGNYPKRRVAN